MLMTSDSNGTKVSQNDSRGVILSPQSDSNGCQKVKNVLSDKLGLLIHNKGGVDHQTQKMENLGQNLPELDGETVCQTLIKQENNTVMHNRGQNDKIA